MPRKSLHSSINNLSYKSLLIILFFLLISIVVLWKFVLPNHKVEASWWNDGWNYRKAISIGNTGTAQTNTQIKILDNYDLSALVTAGKLQADLDDLRFTDSNGNLLKYWIEDSTNNSVDIWAFLPSLPTSYTTIYMYYGNPNATTGESATGTLELPGISCLAIKLSGVTTDGVYYIDPTAQETSDKFQTYCDLTTNSGGWTLALRIATEDAENLTYSSAYWTNSSLLGTDPTNVRADYKSKSYSTIAFNKILIQSFKDGTKEAWRSFLSSTTHSSMQSIMSQSCQLLVGSTISSGGTPHAQDPVLFGNQLYASCTNLDNNSDNARIIPANTCNFDAVYGFGTAGDGGIADRRTDDAGPNAGSWHCDNASDKFYGYSNQCYTNGTLDYSKKLGDYSWAIFIQEPNIPAIGSIANISVSSAEEAGGGPIAYWKFDEGSGTTAYDSSSNQNNGSFLSAPVWKNESECVSGKCLAFDNVDDGVSINKNFAGLTDYTMSAWINLKGTHKNYAGAIMSSGNWNNQWWSFCINQANSGIYLYGIGTKNYNFQLNKWTYVTVTRSGGLYTFYVDGKNIGNFTASSNPLVSDASNTTIGRETYAGGYFAFNGWIDEPKIYPYARTAAQIKLDYNSRGSKGTSANLGGAASDNNLSNGLVGYWKMDENTGTTTADSSGNSNTGTLNSASWDSGKFGIGTTFNGSSSYTNVTNTAALSPTSGVTLSTWVKRGVGESVADLIYKQSSYGLELYPNNGAVLEGIINSSRSKCGDTIPDSQWVLATMTYTQGTNKVRLFLNGVECSNYIQADNTSGAAIASNSNDVKIGGPTWIEGYFNGSLDEVRIYNRALSPSEVSQLYEYAPGPNAYWNFENDPTSTITDKSGNGLNLSVSGSPIFVTGKYGNALKFNGGSDAATSISTSILDTDYHTIGFWLKFNQAAPAYFAKIFTYGPTGTNRSPGIWTYTNQNCLHWRYDPGNSGPTSCGGPNGENTYFNINQWYYITGVKNRDTFNFYVNGSLIESGTVSFPKTSGVSTISLGGGSPFVSIDEVKIYNYARTQKQIIEDMNASHPAVSAKSAIAYYKFDEGYGTTASNWGNGGTTLNGTFGTGSSAPTWSNGKFNKALSFDGNDYITTSLSNNFAFGTNAFAISFWFNINSAPTYSTYIDTRESDIPNAGLNIGCNWNGTNGNKMYVYYNGLNIETNTLNTNSWYHAVIVGNGGANGSRNIKMFLNGKQVGSTFTVDYNMIHRALTIGGHTTARNMYFSNGLIDELKIYNYALTDDEIKQDYNQGSAIQMGQTSQTISGTTTSLDYCIPGDTSPCASPVAEWKLDEGSGSSINDTSGNNLTSTFTGSPTWTQGKIGKALSFNGSTNGVSLSGPGTYAHETMSAWVYIDSSSPSGDIVGNCHTNYNSEYGFTFYLDGNTLRAKAATNGFNYFYNNITYDVTSLKNRWLHLTMTWDNLGTGTGGCDATAKLYVNGQQVDVGTTNFSGGGGYDCTRPYYYPFSMGGTTQSTLVRPTKVKLDQVRIYNYARTPAQIAYDYNKGGPVGWWKFDECQGNIAYDWSGVGNTGTIIIGASGTQNSLGTCQSGTSAAWTNGATGKINSSLNFDGVDDYITLSPITNYLSGNFSYSAWVKLNTNVGAAVKNAISSEVSSYSNYWSVIGTYSNKWNFALYEGSHNPIAFSNDNFVLNTWTHIVGVRDVATSKIYIYINGVLQGNGTTDTTTSVPAYSAFNIGGQVNVANRFFPGQIDDVRIYNYALTSEQIKTLYNGGAVSFN